MASSPKECLACSCVIGCESTVPVSVTCFAGEPFGALDAYTRILLQKRLLDIWEKDRKTVVFVTHSVDEAVFLADRIIIMSTNPGRILTEMPVSLPRARDNTKYASLGASILNLLEQQSKNE